MTLHANSSRTSLSRAPSRTSNLSRTQSLIKRNIELHDLVPSDVLIERFVAWKAIVKQLIAYFEGIADIQNNTAREMNKLSSVVQVPFRSGNQFLGEGGLQDVYYAIRDKTRVIADQHADLGRTVDSSIVQHLQKLRTEIKAHIKNIQNDTGKLAANVAKEREVSTRLIGELANDISAFKNTPMNVSSRTDPYVANMHVAIQLQKQVLEENLLQKSIIMMQQNSAHFEEGIVRSIQSAWVTFDEWQSRAAASQQETLHTLGEQMASLEPDKEWISFAARSDHLLDPDTPLRDPEAIQYPLKDDPSVIPVHQGYLERKQRFTRTYKEGYFVLTPAGFLHSFASSDLSNNSTPTFSLFLPLCTLGPPSTPSSKSHKFHIEGRKDGLGTTKGGPSIKSMFSRDSQRAWSFRARSREEMMEWWNDIRMLCARYLVASEQMERTGPVEAAVRAVGYASDQEEDDEEWDGSSVEEEAAEDDGEEEVYEDVTEDGPPGYHHPAHQDKAYAGEVNQNGYLVDKKAFPGQYPEPEQGAQVTRRPSKRQQEKAPEGRPPRMYHDHDDEAPVIDRDSGAPGMNTSPPARSEPGPSMSYQAAPVAEKNNDSHIIDLGHISNGSANGSARGSVHEGPGSVTGSGEGMKPISANPTGNTDAQAGPAPVESRFQEGL